MLCGTIPTPAKCCQVHFAEYRNFSGCKRKCKQHRVLSNAFSLSLPLSLNKLFYTQQFINIETCTDKSWFFMCVCVLHGNSCNVHCSIVIIFWHAKFLWINWIYLQFWCARHPRICSKLINNFLHRCKFRMCIILTEIARCISNFLTLICIYLLQQNL